MSKNNRKNSRTFQLYIVVPPGLELICKQETEALGFSDVEVLPGGLRLETDISGIWRTNLWLRSASRVLIELASFKVRDFPGLFQKTSRLPWGQYIKEGQTVTVQATCKTSRLLHTGRISETVIDAVNKSLGRAIATTAGSSKHTQTVYLRLIDDHCTISIDSSGNHLHQRGYRKNPGAAPLRENLAAGLLLSTGWQPEIPLIDPMCGSGTFLIEAAMISKGVAPGCNRHFAFKEWPGFHQGKFEQLLTLARGGEDSCETRPIRIFGSDQSAEVIAEAREHATIAHVDDLIDFSCQKLENLSAPAPSGVLISNPPYGERIGSKESAAATYRLLGKQLQEKLTGWQGYVIAPDSSLPNEAYSHFKRGARSNPEEILTFPHGGKRAGFYLLG